MARRYKASGRQKHGVSGPGANVQGKSLAAQETITHEKEDTTSECFYKNIRMSDERPGCRGDCGATGAGGV